MCCMHGNDAGIPTGEWSSSLFACYQNILPSCVVSFFCPCVMFGQLVVRAQIPLYISLKNQFSGPDRTSGYCFFLWLYFFCIRSEEHTSELQSLMRISYAVFCLKKKNNKNI